jgi:predicted nucleic acid-binding protein
MALDPTRFSPASVADTCSVWNMLSSRKLYQAAINAKLHFCVTGMVLYECLQKPRSFTSSERTEMMQRLERARRSGGFPMEACSLDDLADISRQAPKGLGSGELSCIAVAYRVRSIAFMTDEKQARHVGLTKFGLNVETTPKLYAWLHYRQHLGGSDHEDVIREHEMYESRPLTHFFREAYEEAMRCRLMAQPVATRGAS